MAENVAAPGALTPAAQAPTASAPRAPQFAGPAQAGKQRRDPRSLAEEADDPDDTSLGLVEAPLSLGATFSLSGSTAVVTAIGPPSPFGNKYRRWYEVTLTNTGSGYIERFLVQPPSASAPLPAPMLVLFHKYGAGQQDVVNSTSFIWEVLQRGWYLVAPVGASKKHFSSIESQINTEAVLDWMLAHFAIDTTRIYGVGFSMGGGAAMNYAARHLDPTHAMFAAVIDHSGGVALKDTYLNDPAVDFILDFWFGDGSPGSAESFRLARSSVINFDPVTLQVETDADLARNLLHLPLKILRASNDTVAYLSRQSDVLDQYFQSHGRQPGPTYAYDILPYTGHSWDLLDETTACDWLALQTLALPTSGNTLADHDGTYFRFSVVQDAQGAFSPFVWSLDSAQNKVALSDTENITSLSLDPGVAGLSTTQPILVTVATADGLPDRVRFLNYPAAPLSVLRDGVPESSWTYDPQTLELTLTEYDGGPHQWQVQP